MEILGSTGIRADEKYRARRAHSRKSLIKAWPSSLRLIFSISSSDAAKSDADSSRVNIFEITRRTFLLSRTSLLERILASLSGFCSPWNVTRTHATPQTRSRADTYCTFVRVYSAILKKQHTISSIIEYKRVRSLVLVSVFLSNLS